MRRVEAKPRAYGVMPGLSGCRKRSGLCTPHYTMVLAIVLWKSALLFSFLRLAAGLPAITGLQMIEVHKPIRRSLREI